MQKGFDVISFVICGLFQRIEKDILKILANGLVHGGLAVACPSFQERHPHTLKLHTMHTLKENGKRHYEMCQKGCSEATDI